MTPTGYSNDACYAKLADGDTVFVMKIGLLRQLNQDFALPVIDGDAK